MTKKLFTKLSAVFVPEGKEAAGARAEAFLELVGSIRDRPEHLGPAQGRQELLGLCGHRPVDFLEFPRMSHCIWVSILSFCHFLIDCILIIIMIFVVVGWF